jgi:nanoRNase/pAp phosphatase (c-di-AMP/oligoRNAs hydrolase)
LGFFGNVGLPLHQHSGVNAFHLQIVGSGNAFIDGSLRTKSHTLDPDKWLKDVFGKNEEGKWYGGGRKDKGGFQIPLGVFSKCSDRELLWILIKKTIDELFYKKIGIDSQSSRDSDLGSGKV